MNECRGRETENPTLYQRNQKPRKIFCVTLALYLSSCFFILARKNYNTKWKQRGKNNGHDFLFDSFWSVCFAFVHIIIIGIDALHRCCHRHAKFCGIRLFIRWVLFIDQTWFFSFLLCFDIIWYCFFVVVWFATINASASLFASFNFVFVRWLCCYCSPRVPIKRVRMRSIEANTDFCGQALNVYRFH